MAEHATLRSRRRAHHLRGRSLRAGIGGRAARLPPARGDTDQEDHQGDRKPGRRGLWNHESTRSACPGRVETQTQSNIRSNGRVITILRWTVRTGQTFTDNCPTLAPVGWGVKHKLGFSEQPRLLPGTGRPLLYFFGQPAPGTMPVPSLMTRNWSAGNALNFSCRPLGQRISTSAIFSGPKPKCNRESLLE